MAWSKEKQEARKQRRLARRKAEDPDYDPKTAAAKGSAKAGRIVSLNFADPDKVADTLIDINSPDFSGIESTAKRLGLPENIIRALKGRLRARLQPLGQALRENTTKGFLAQMEDRLDRALHYLDDYALSGATAKDLAVIIGILTEKRQLLRGEPTAILSSEERVTLNALIPVVVREAQRRGITIDMNSGEPIVTGGRQLLPGAHG